MVASAICNAALLFLIAGAGARAQAPIEGRAAAQSQSASGSVLIVDTLRIRTLPPTSVAGQGARAQKNGTFVSTIAVLEVSGGSHQAYSLSLSSSSKGQAMLYEAWANSSITGNAAAVAHARRTDEEGRDVLRIGGQTRLPGHAVSGEAATALRIGFDYP